MPPITEEEKRRRREERTRKRPEERKEEGLLPLKPEVNTLDVGLKKAFIERKGEQFAIGRREAAELGARGKLRPGESIAEQAQQRESKQKQVEVLPVLEEEGVFEERPERVELSPTQEEIERGRPGSDAGVAFVEEVLGKESGEFAKELGISENVLNDLIKNPETQRQFVIQEIQREELDIARTASQKLGALLEPFLGDLKVFDVDVGGYVDKLVRMPKKEVDLIVEQIAELESSVSGMTDSASQGEIGNPVEVVRDIAEKEEQLAIYEARIKRAIIESVELRANPEQVNLIEEKILAARETFFEAKQRAAEGALITPTDSQLYLKLLSIRNENK